MSANIYYDPEKFALTPIGELEYSGGNYEFDTRVVWRDQSGHFLTARDSGCSCPLPFDTIGIGDCLRFESGDGVCAFLREEWKNDRAGYVSAANLDALCLKIATASEQPTSS